jgi:hypothetical protein
MIILRYLFVVLWLCSLEHEDLNVLKIKMPLLLLLLMATKDDKLLTKCQTRYKVRLCCTSKDLHKSTRRCMLQLSLVTETETST